MINFYRKKRTHTHPASVQKIKFTKIKTASFEGYREKQRRKLDPFSTHTPFLSGKWWRNWVFFRSSHSQTKGENADYKY